MIEEHRKYPRAQFDCEILYPKLLDSDKSITYSGNNHLYAVDLSEAGICMASSFFVPNDSFMSFYLRVDDNLPFKTLVKIRWQKTESGMNLCGGEFAALNLNEIHILRNYVLTHTK